MIREGKTGDDLGDVRVSQLTDDKSLNLEDGLEKERRLGSRTCGSERQRAAPFSPDSVFTLNAN